MIQLCRHVFEGNHQCAAPALRGQRFCRHHRGIHDYQRRSGLRSKFQPQSTDPIPSQSYDHGTILVADRNTQVYPPLHLLYPEDRASIQANIYFVADYLARGLMDRSNATALIYAMQVAQTNLGKRPLIDPAAAATPASTRSESHSRDITLDESSETPYSETAYSNASTPATALFRPVHRVILTPDGDEIAPPVEILEDNEAEPIHHKACPCLQCAEKYRNQLPEEHHPNCTCGLCEEQEPEKNTGHSSQSSELPEDNVILINNGVISINDVILSEARTACEVEGPASSNQDHASAESRDLQLSESAATERARSFAQRRVGRDAYFMNCHPEQSEAESKDLLLVNAGKSPNTTTLSPDPCALTPRPRLARASALLSGSASRDPLNRPWSVAEYTFGDAIRRHEAQYAARAAAALAVGIEPPPYEPFTTGLIPPGHPEYDEDQQIQQRSSEYWVAHFRKLIADRPDIQRQLEQEAESSES